MPKLKIFIVEDEKNNRERLIYLLNEHFGQTVEIVGTSSTVRDAVTLLSNSQVDTLLLDIELADGQVFDLLNQIDYKKYQLVFITGYSEHAIKAIKYAAVDYLLKPIDAKELITAVGKVRERKMAENPELEDMLDRRKFDLADYLVINSFQHVEKIPIEHISHLQADGIYTNIFHNNTTTVSSKPIGIYEDILPAGQFNRCHKSFIVNKKFIKKVGMGRGLDLTLHRGEELPVSVRKKDEFMLWYKS